MAGAWMVGLVHCCLLGFCLHRVLARDLPAKCGPCFAGVLGGSPVYFTEGFGPACVGCAAGLLLGVALGALAAHGWRHRVLQSRRLATSPMEELGLCSDARAAMEAAAAVLESFRLGGAQEVRTIASGAGCSSEALLCQLLRQALAGQAAAGQTLAGPAPAGQLLAAQLPEVGGASHRGGGRRCGAGRPSSCHFAPALRWVPCWAQRLRAAQACSLRRATVRTACGPWAGCRVGEAKNTGPTEAGALETQRELAAAALARAGILPPASAGPEGWRTPSLWSGASGAVPRESATAGGPAGRQQMSPPFPTVSVPSSEAATLLDATPCLGERDALLGGEAAP
ncbi:unnamed protein product, partial [Effrenium voratum]